MGQIGEDDEDESDGEDDEEEDDSAQGSANLDADVKVSATA